MKDKMRAVRISLHPVTHRRLLAFAEHIDCVSWSGRPMAAAAVRKVLRVVLKFYNDDAFQKCLEIEGIDALAFIERCVKRGMKETLAEVNRKQRSF